jgi:hypothetical protein
MLDALLHTWLFSKSKKLFVELCGLVWCKLSMIIIDGNDFLCQFYFPILEFNPSKHFLFKPFLSTNQLSIDSLVYAPLPILIFLLCSGIVVQYV